MDEEELEPSLAAIKDEVEHRVSELFPRNLTSLLDTEAGTSKGNLLVQKASQKDATAPLTVAQIDLESMQVTVRIRPSLEKSVPCWDTLNCIHAVTLTSLAIAPPEDSQGYKSGCRGNTYSFSRVFDGNTSQQDYFAATAAPMVNKMLSARQKNCVMMAYGTSAAGKTHTIEGTKADPGVLPRSLELLFQKIQQLQERISVRVSRYEVYNERIYDLLNEGVPPLEGWRHLELKEDAHGCVFIEGLKETEITDMESGMEVLRRSSRQRRKATTGLNYSSSRSHSIFTVTLCWPANELPEERTRMSFVDLAGSERVKNTGNTGERLGESKSINSSLMTLRYCLENLRWNQKNSGAKPRQLPYRESKITHLFRDVLHGWGAILFCVNVSPTASDYDATASVLQYATMATQIGNAARAEAPRRALKAKSPNITKKRSVPALAVPVQRPAWVEPVADLREPSAEAAVQLRRLADQNEELEDARLELMHQVQTLTHELAQVSERAALAESEIRDSVAAEMGELLRDMEASYKDRLAAETLQIEKKLRKQLQGGRQPDRAPPPQPVLEAQTTADASKEQAEVLRLEKLLEEEEDRCNDLSTRLVAAEAREAELASELASQERLHAAAIARLEQQATEASADFSSRLKAAEQRETELAAELCKADARVANLDDEVKHGTATRAKMRSDVKETIGDIRDSLMVMTAANAETQAQLDAALAKLTAAAEMEAQLTAQVKAAEDRAAELLLSLEKTAAELALTRFSPAKSESDRAKVCAALSRACTVAQGDKWKADAKCAELTARVEELEAQNWQLSEQLKLEEQHAAAAQAALVSAERAQQTLPQPGWQAEGQASRSCGMGECDTHIKQEAAEIATATPREVAAGVAAGHWMDSDGKRAMAAQLREHEASIRQLQMNAAAEHEMLESQLERAAKEKAALESRLHIALGCSPAGIGKQGAPGAPTPHFVALARAQQAAANSTPGMQADMARQGSARASRLQNTATAFSPAIQWAATPEEAQIASGKVHALLPDASTTDQMATLAFCPPGDASEQPGTTAKDAGRNDQLATFATYPTVEASEQPDGTAKAAEQDVCTSYALGNGEPYSAVTISNQPGCAAAGITGDASHSMHGPGDQSSRPEVGSGDAQGDHCQASQEAGGKQACASPDPERGRPETCEAQRAGIGSGTVLPEACAACREPGSMAHEEKSQQGADIKEEPANAARPVKGSLHTSGQEDGATSVKIEPADGEEFVHRECGGNPAAEAGAAQKTKRRGRKAGAENSAGAQENEEAAGQSAKQRTRRTRKATAEAEPLGERNQADGQEIAGTEDAAGKPETKRRRRLLEPTPMKVRVALGQAAADDDLLDMDNAAAVAPPSESRPAIRARRMPASSRKPAAALARVSEEGSSQGAEGDGQVTAVARRTRRRKA